MDSSYPGSLFEGHSCTALSQKRPPLDIRSIVLSPYGLLIGGMLLIMLFSSKMKVDGETSILTSFSLISVSRCDALQVDPEEYKEAMKEMKTLTGGAKGAETERIQQRKDK